MLVNNSLLIVLIVALLSFSGYADEMIYNSSELHYRGINLLPEAELKSFNFTEVNQSFDYQYLQNMIINSSITEEQIQKIFSSALAGSNADQQAYIQNTFLPSVEKLSDLESQVEEKQKTIEELAKSLQACGDSVQNMNNTYSLYQQNLEKTNEQYSWIIIAILGSAAVLIGFYIYEKKEGRIFG